MKLVIGNKNYSSWSLRPWALLRQAGIAFDEDKLSFLSPTFKRDVLARSPAGRVPILIDGELTVWDSLAIAEYVAEKLPDKMLWPADRADRAHARSICAEMHSGFTSVRTYMPMNVTAQLPGRGWNVNVQKDIDRIAAIWTGLRAKHSAAGPFLFGRFGVVDAYYAPVVFRFNTYRPELPAAAREYVQQMLQTVALREWVEAAAVENEWVPEDEPYRTKAR